MMAESNSGATKQQEVKMFNRKMIEISGVSRVDSFNSEQFLLDTTCGFLTIKGYDLHIKNLNLNQGLLAIEGRIQSVVYLDENAQDKSKGLFWKLFK